MELDVPAANDALRSDLAHCSGHRDTKLILRARLAVVFHRHAEGATVAAAGAVECDHHDIVDRAIDVQAVYVIDIVEVAFRAARFIGSSPI